MLMPVHAVYCLLVVSFTVNYVHPMSSYYLYFFIPPFLVISINKQQQSTTYCILLPSSVKYLMSQVVQSNLM